MEKKQLSIIGQTPNNPEDFINKLENIVKNVGNDYSDVDSTKNKKSFFETLKEWRQTKKNKKAKKDLEYRLYREDRIIDILESGYEEEYSEDSTNSKLKEKAAGLLMKNYDKKETEYKDIFDKQECENLIMKYFKSLNKKRLTEEQIAEKILKMKFAHSLEIAKEIAKLTIKNGQSIYKNINDKYLFIIPILGVNKERLYQFRIKTIDETWDEKPDFI